jgi:hypothetical protein
MTAAEQAEWDLCATPPEYGIWIWIQIMSAISSGGLVVPIGGTSCLSSDAPVVPTFAVDPAAGTIDFRGNITDAEVGTKIVLRMSRPLKPGVFPRVEDTRVIGSVAPNVDVDVASLFSARFGSLPIAGSRALMVSRAVHPQSRRMSVVTNSETDVGTSGDSCSVSSVLPECDPFDFIALDVLANFGAFPAFEELTFRTLTAGWNILSGGTQFNEQADVADIEDTTGVPRIETVEVEWFVTSEGPPGCFDSIELEVLDSGPP